MDEPIVRVFLMGENRWVDLESWPPSYISRTAIYLGAGSGRTEASLNNGRLTFTAPTGAEAADSYTYDPDDAMIAT